MRLESVGVSMRRTHEQQPHSLACASRGLVRSLLCSAPLAVCAVLAPTRELRLFLPLVSMRSHSQLVDANAWITSCTLVPHYNQSFAQLRPRLHVSLHAGARSNPLIQQPFARLHGKSGFLSKTIYKNTWLITIEDHQQILFFYSLFIYSEKKKRRKSIDSKDKNPFWVIARFLPSRLLVPMPAADTSSILTPFAQFKPRNPAKYSLT